MTKKKWFAAPDGQSGNLLNVRSISAGGSLVNLASICSSVLLAQMVLRLVEPDFGVGRGVILAALMAPPLFSLARAILLVAFFDRVDFDNDYTGYRDGELKQEQVR